MTRDFSACHREPQSGRARSFPPNGSPEGGNGGAQQGCVSRAPAVGRGRRQAPSIPNVSRSDATVSRAAANRYFSRLPQKGGGTPPAHTRTILRRERARELILLRLWVATWPVIFRSEIDPAGTAKLMEKFSAAKGSFTDEEAAEAVPPMVAILMAGVRWFGDLQLPRIEPDLWQGPPLRRRGPGLIAPSLSATEDRDLEGGQGR